MAERRIPQYKPIGGYAAPLPVVQPVANTGVSEGLFAAGRMLHDLGVRLGRSGPAGTAAKRDTAYQNSLTQRAANMLAANDLLDDPVPIQKLWDAALEQLEKQGLDDTEKPEVNALFLARMTTGQEEAAETAAGMARARMTTEARQTIRVLERDSPDAQTFSEAAAAFFSGERAAVANNPVLLKLVNELEKETEVPYRRLLKADSVKMEEQRKDAEKTARGEMRSNARELGSTIGTGELHESEPAAKSLVKLIAEAATLYGPDAAADVAREAGRQGLQSMAVAHWENGTYTDFFGRVRSRDGILPAETQLLEFLGDGADESLSAIDSVIDDLEQAQAREDADVQEAYQNAQTAYAAALYVDAENGDLTIEELRQELAAVRIDRDHFERIERRINLRSREHDDEVHGNIVVAIFTDEDATKAELQDMVTDNMEHLSPEAEKSLFSLIDGHFEKIEEMRASGQDVEYRHYFRQLNTLTLGDGDFVYIWERDQRLAKTRAMNSFFHKVHDEGMSPAQAYLVVSEEYLTSQGANNSLFSGHNESIVPRDVIVRREDETIDFAASIAEAPDKVGEESLDEVVSNLKRLEELWGRHPVDLKRRLFPKWKSDE